jgi:hypothetical protein
MLLHCTRGVFSKQNNKKFRFEPKQTEQDLFWVCFGLFCETKNKNLQFVSVCFEPISRQLKQTELFRNKPKQPKIFRKIPKYTLF